MSVCEIRKGELIVTIKPITKLNEVTIKDNRLYALGKCFKCSTNNNLTEEDKIKYIVKYQLPKSYINVIFNSKSEFITFYNELLKCEYLGMFFHEKIQDNIPIRLCFDIDISKSDDVFNEYDNNLIDVIKENLIKPLKDLNIDESIYNNVIIASNHRKLKKSLRIIFKSIYFKNVKSLKEFVIAKFQKYNNIIDLGIYGNGSLRFIYSSKRGICERFEPIKQTKFNNECFVMLDDINDLHLIDYEVKKETVYDILDNKCQDINYQYVEGLLSTEYPEILKHYRLKERLNTGKHLYRLDNRSNAICAVNPHITHERENAYLSIVDNNGSFYVYVSCYRCKSKYDEGDTTLEKSRCLKVIEDKNYDKTERTFYNELKIENKKETSKNFTFNGYETYFTNNKYLEIEEIKPHIYKCLYLALYCAGGKTTITAKIIKEIFDNETNHKNIYILFLSCRRTLTYTIDEGINKQLGELNIKPRFESYLLENEKTIKEFKSNFRIISPESLYKCDDLVGEENINKRVYIINEEYPHLIKQFSSKETHKGNLITNRNIYEQLIKKAFGVCNLSATPDNVTTKYIYDLSPLPKLAVDFNNKEPIKSLQIYKDKDNNKIMNKLFNEIENKNFPIGVGWFRGVASKNGKCSPLVKFVKVIKSFYPELNISIICSTSNKNDVSFFGKTPDKYLEDNKTELFIYTTTGYIGIDIQTVFKSAFYFFNFCSANDPSDGIQLIWRLRQCAVNYIIMTYYKKKLNTDGDNLTQSIKPFEVIIKDVESKLKNKNCDIDIQRLNQVVRSFDCIEKVNEERTKYLWKHYETEFNKYSVNNRIKLLFTDENEEENNLYNEKEISKLKKEISIEERERYTEEYKNVPLINVNEYEILQKEITKTKEDYIKINKYFLYKYGFTGEITKETLICHNTYRNEIYNIRLLCQFTITEELNEDFKDENKEIIKIANYILTTKRYEGMIWTEKSRNISFNNICKSLGLDNEIKTSFTTEGFEKSSKEKILKDLTYKLLNVEELLQDEELNIKHLLKELTDNKFKSYVTLYLLYLFELPILENITYNKEDFTTLCNKIHTTLTKKYKLNPSLWNAYLTYLGYTEKIKIKTLLKDDKKTMLKRINEFIKKIIKPFGMMLKFKEDKHKSKKHKYIIHMKKILQENISVFKKDGRIAIINYYENEYTQYDADTKDKITKLSILLK